MKILITGGGGFIGGALYGYLRHKHEVDAFNHLSLDLLNKDRVTNLLKNRDYDVVIHCANYDAAPRFSKNDPNKVYVNNMQMFNNLAENNHLFSKMFYFGSGAETFVANNYAESKREMNRLINQKYDNIFNLRIYSVYGPGADWRYRIVNNLCAKAALGQPLVIPENRVSDFLHIYDLCKMVDLMLLPKLENKTYDLCSGELWYYADVAKEISLMTGVPIASPTERKACVPSSYCGDNTLFTKEFGQFKFAPLSFGIWVLIDYYKLYNKLDLSLFEY